MRRTINRKSLSELAQEMRVLNASSQSACIGGGTGTELDPFTYAEYQQLMHSGNWAGGYVQGSVEHFTRDVSGNWMSTLVSDAIYIDADNHLLPDVVVTAPSGVITGNIYDERYLFGGPEDYPRFGISGHWLDTSSLLNPSTEGDYGSVGGGGEASSGHPQTPSLKNSLPPTLRARIGGDLIGFKPEDIVSIKTHYEEMRKYDAFRKFEDYIYEKHGLSFRNIKRVDKNIPGSASISLKTGDLSIYFVDGETFLPFGTFAHELIHVLQIKEHSQPGLDLNTYRAAMETEATLILDVLRYIDIQKGDGSKWSITNTIWLANTYNISTNRIDSEAYLKWLRKITKKGKEYPTEISQDDFERWGEALSKGGGSYSEGKINQTQPPKGSYTPTVFNEFFKAYREQQ